jgi:hypothetical protein
LLDPQEKYVFDGMVTRLHADDPAFLRRIDQINRPRRRLRVNIAILLWTMAPLCVIFGGWTGLIIATVSCLYGGHLVSRRADRAGALNGLPWRSRPGATPTL